MARPAAPSWCVQLEKPCCTLVEYSEDGTQLQNAHNIKGASLVGRLEGVADLIVDTPTASRKHAWLGYCTATSVAVEDLASAHGTYLNGQRLPKNQKVSINLGESLRFGTKIGKFFRIHGISDQGEVLPLPTSDTATSLQEDRRSERTSMNGDPLVAACLSNDRTERQQQGEEWEDRRRQSNPVERSSAADFGPPAKRSRFTTGSSVEIPKLHKEEKRQLLWGAKKITSASASQNTQQWASSAGALGDDRGNKFLRMMGVKDKDVQSAEGSAVAQQQDHLFNDLERDFYQGRRRLKAGTLGLGL